MCHIHSKILGRLLSGSFHLKTPSSPSASLGPNLEFANFISSDSGPECRPDNQPQFIDRRQQWSDSPHFTQEKTPLNKCLVIFMWGPWARKTKVGWLLRTSQNPFLLLFGLPVCIGDPQISTRLPQVPLEDVQRLLQHRPRFAGGVGSEECHALAPQCPGASQAISIWLWSFWDPILG